MNFEDAKKLLAFFRTDRHTAEEERQTAIYIRLQMRLIKGQTPAGFTEDWERICACLNAVPEAQRTPEQRAELQALHEKHQAQIEAMWKEEEAAHDAEQT